MNKKIRFGVMKAMILEKTGLLSENDTPLRLVELPIPKPGPGEILVKVLACGVCHTELDEIEGRMAPPRLPVVPGHEIVGRVEECGSGATRFAAGTRVGIGWIHSSTGRIDENLSPTFRATGRDVNGGYAEYTAVPENYAYPIPAIYSDTEAAPLLCAGAVGYRALKLANLRDGQPVGLTGFGGSAHLVLPLIRHLYPASKIYVFARDKQVREFALELGAIWTGNIIEHAPEPLAAIIDTTPAWKPVVEALGNLRAGGRLIINAIRKEDTDKDILLKLSYHHHLWMEKEIKSVANVTGSDLAEFLPLAAQIPIRTTVQTYRLDDANRALIELRRGKIKGAKVLCIGSNQPPAGQEDF